MTELAKRQQENNISLDGNVFNGLDEFRMAQRMAQALVSSNMVPDTFKNDIGSCMIALDMASRLKMNVLAVMQNMYIVHGKPAWSSQFIISSINQSGLFGSSLHFDFVGEKGKDSYGCYAWVYEKGTKEKVIGTTITIAMAKAEGWYNKNGSKWKTMPEQMLRYRAASFFGRTYAPDVTMGIYSKDEVEDIESKTLTIIDTDEEMKKEIEEKANVLDLNTEFEEVPAIEEKTTVDQETGEIKEEAQGTMFTPEEQESMLSKAPF